MTRSLKFFFLLADVFFLQYCQMCKKGDNEDLLLLCDGCDKGCHTYCHKPKITSIPEGDWYCPACISTVLPHVYNYQISTWYLLCIYLVFNQ